MHIIYKFLHLNNCTTKCENKYLLLIWVKPCISDLENDLSNNSIKYISLQLINIIPRSCMQKKNCQTVAKITQILLLSDLSNLEKYLYRNSNKSKFLPKMNKSYPDIF